MVIRSCANLRSIWCDCYGADVASVTNQCCQASTAGDVKQLGGPIIGSSDYSSSIRCDCNGPDCVSVASKCEKALLVMSNILAVLSLDPVITFLESRVNTTDITQLV